MWQVMSTRRPIPGPLSALPCTSSLASAPSFCALRSPGFPTSILPPQEKQQSVRRTAKRACPQGRSTNTNCRLGPWGQTTDWTTGRHACPLLPQATTTLGAAGAPPPRPQCPFVRPCPPQGAAHFVRPLDDPSTCIFPSRWPPDSTFFFPPTPPFHPYHRMLSSTVTRSTQVATLVARRHISHSQVNAREMNGPV